MAEEVARFERDGYAVVRGAVPPEVMAACPAGVAAGLRAEGVDPHGPATWSRPVVRLGCPDSPAFAAARTQRVLWSAYDQLLEPGTWWRRPGVGGTIPVRFPHEADPSDAGWHIDGSYDVDGEYWVNVASRDRGLLALFLLSDVGDDDAPTELKVGSHLDVPALAEPFGETGASFATISRQLPSTTFQWPSAFATGTAGDVYLCHPFLVHRATWPHRGRHPRAIAQPGIAIHRPFRLGPQPRCPVEAAILAGLPMSTRDGDGPRRRPSERPGRGPAPAWGSCGVREVSCDGGMVPTGPPTTRATEPATRDRQRDRRPVRLGPG